MLVFLKRAFRHARVRFKNARFRPSKGRTVTMTKIPSRRLTIELLCLQLCLRAFSYNFSFFTYNWSFFAYNSSSFCLQWEIHPISTLRDCKQRNSTANKKLQLQKSFTCEKLLGNENSAQSFSDRSFWKSLRVVDVRAFGSWMSAPKCLFSQGLGGPDRSFGPGYPREWPRDVRGISGPKTSSLGCFLVADNCLLIVG